MHTPSAVAGQPGRTDTLLTDEIVSTVAAASAPLHVMESRSGSDKAPPGEAPPGQIEGTFGESYWTA